jgi:hypothetical protein
LHDHSLATGVAAVEHDHRLVWLEKLHHFVLHSRLRRGGRVGGTRIGEETEAQRRILGLYNKTLGFSVERA